MKDKNIHKVADLLFPLAQTIFLTSFPYKRAATPESIKAQVPTRGRNVLLEPDLKRAIQKALEITPGRGSLLITGSLFLVGEVKKRIRQWSKTHRASP
jgi:dihydrofolate synthase/folylpolyglutamate synthase